jgi:DNA-directed RNA polymerase subunit RPC12/RpoP
VSVDPYAGTAGDVLYACLYYTRPLASQRGMAETACDECGARLVCLVAVRDEKRADAAAHGRGFRTICHDCVPQDRLLVRPRMDEYVAEGERVVRGAAARALFGADDAG